MSIVRIALLLSTSVAAAASPAAQAAQSCHAASAHHAPIIVELYTSEGCSSCPPADKWLSTLKGRADVLPLAFHVNYWDRLGWVDRFANPASTQRQYDAVHASGSNAVYTPQVLVDGRVWREWARQPVTAGASASASVAGTARAAGTPNPLQATLVRAGDQVTLQVAATHTGPARLQGYWAVLEDGYQSHVGAGENAGRTLQHDAVVRLYQPLAAWPAAAGTHASLKVSPGVAEHPRRVVFVVTDAATQRPLQAVTLAC